MNLSTIKERIIELADPKRKAFNEKLDPNQSKMYGLTIPQLRKLSKDIAKENPYEFLDQNDFSCYELEQLQAMVIGLIKDIDAAMNYFEEFIPFVHGWSVNDTLCMDFKIARKHKKRVFNFLKSHMFSNKEFEQRVVAVMILCHFLDDEYIDASIHVLQHLRVESYYAEMAVGWAFATILAKYPDKGIAFMRTQKLRPKAYLKAIQKAIESYRVSDEIKAELKLLRISFKQNPQS